MTWTSCFSIQKHLALPRLFLVVFALLTSLTSVASSASSYHVVMVANTKSGPHLEVIKTIDSIIENNPYLKTTCAVILTEDIATKSGNYTELEGADVIITIGQTAIDNILASRVKKPVLATLIPKKSFEHSLESNNDLPTLSNVSAIYLDNPPIRQLLLTEILLGAGKRIGFLTSKQYADEIEALKNAGYKNGLYLVRDIFNPNENIISQVSNTLSRSDAFIALPDPLVFNRNSAKNILLTSYRHRVPLIAYSRTYVNAGALAATYSSPEQIAMQASEIILNILGSDMKYRHNSEYPKYFSVAVNRNVARSLGINPPTEDIIRNRIIDLVETLDENYRN